MTYARPIVKAVELVTADCSCYPAPTPEEECLEAGGQWVGDISAGKLGTIPVGCLRQGGDPTIILDGWTTWAIAAQNSLRACVLRGGGSPDCPLPEWE